MPTLTEAIRDLDVLVASIYSLSVALRPGLSRAYVAALLAREGLEEQVGIVQLYRWRDGESDTATAGLIPESTYKFLSLNDAISHYQEFHAIKHVSLGMQDLGAVLGRLTDYFPLFWDGSTGYLAIGVSGPDPDSIVLIDPEDEQMVRKVYDSMESFILDIIRAHAEDDTLSCFRYQ